MQMDWLLVGKALCLMAVIEGLVLALMPRRARMVAAMIMQMNDRALRGIGLGGMVLGAALLLILT